MKLAGGTEVRQGFTRTLAPNRAYVKLAFSIARRLPTLAKQNKDMEPDLLVETNVEILEQVRKDLTQEYLRLMSHALQVSRRILQPLEPATDAPPARPY